MDDHPHPSSLTLSQAEMKTLGYRIVDHLVDHHLSLREKPVTRIGTPAELRELIRDDLPEKPTPADQILSQVLEHVLGHIMHTTHPRFLAFVPSPSNFVSVMADALVSGYNPFAGTWMEASGPAQVESVTLGWLCRLFGLPGHAGGILTSGGSMANLTGLAVARHSLLGEDFHSGMVYTSDQTHASVERGLRVLGFSRSQIRIVPSDTAFRLPVSELEGQVALDLAAGRRPFCVIANAGTTNTGAVDPLPELAAFCTRNGLWLHVDAAYGGAAILTERGRLLLSGLELADSIVIDPHKWLFQPYEIGCVLVRDREQLHRAFHYQPEYLQDLQSSQEEINYSEYGVQLTRSFRALKLWMSLKVFGLEAFRDAVERGFELAALAQSRIEQLAWFTLFTPAQMGVVTFRFEPPGIVEKVVEKLNQALIRRLINTGYAMISSTQLRGQTVLRMCLINPRTTADDLKQIFDHVDELSRELI